MRNALAALFVLLLLAFGFWGMMRTPESTPVDGLNRSAIGLAGLPIWLQSQGVEVLQSRSLSDGFVDDETPLRILPLYDTDFDTADPLPLTRTGFTQQADLRHIDIGTFRRKLQSLPTLVLLPKWTGGVLLDRQAHESRLVPMASLDRLLGQMSLKGATLIRGTDAFEPGETDLGTIATLFHAQSFDPATLPDYCDPALRLDTKLLAISCARPGLPETYFLSDPDLMNNHGLALAGNAERARAFLDRLLWPVAKRDIGRYRPEGEHGKRQAGPRQGPGARCRGSRAFLRLSLLGLLGDGNAGDRAAFLARGDTVRPAPAGRGRARHRTFPRRRHRRQCAAGADLRQ